MKQRQKSCDKQTVPLKCFTWNKPDKKYYGSTLQSLSQKKYQISSSEKLKKVQKGYDNLFILTKKNEKCYYSNITVQFTTINQDNEQQVVLPIFNRDKKYFTPGFIINQDLPYFQQRSVQYQYDQFHQKKKAYQGEANNQVDEYFKKRQPRSRYCYVCKKFYENNYYQHIKQADHKQQMRNSVGESYILATLNEFKKDKLIKKRVKKIRAKDIQDNMSQQIVINYPRKTKIISKQIKFKYFKKDHIQTRSKSFKSNVSSQDQTECLYKTRRR